MSTIKVNNILDVSGTALPSNLLPVTPSAWVNFNGTATVTIQDSYNVSSITDNGIGDYTVNFTNSLSDSNYAVSGSCNVNSVAVSQGTSVTTSAADIITFRGDHLGNVGSVDPARVSVVIFGGQ